MCSKPFLSTSEVQHITPYWMSSILGYIYSNRITPSAYGSSLTFVRRKNQWDFSQHLLALLLSTLSLSFFHFPDPWNLSTPRPRGCLGPPASWRGSSPESGSPISCPSSCPTPTGTSKSPPGGRAGRDKRKKSRKKNILPNIFYFISPFRLIIFREKPTRGKWSSLSARRILWLCVEDKENTQTGWGRRRKTWDYFFSPRTVFHGMGTDWQAGFSFLEKTL